MQCDWAGPNRAKAPHGMQQNTSIQFHSSLTICIVSKCSGAGGGGTADLCEVDLLGQVFAFD